MLIYPSARLRRFFSCVETYDIAAIRRHRPGKIDDCPQRRQPLPQVHVDQTTESAIARVYRHVLDNADELVKHRFQIINLWRPIHHAAFDFPLTFCDYRSVNPKEDLVPVTLKRAVHDGENNGVRYSPDHKWKYLRGMRPEEAVLIKWWAIRYLEILW